MESRGRTIPEACGSPQSLRNTKTAGEIYLKITPLLIKLDNCISLAQLNVKGHLVLCGSKENSKMWQSRQRTEGQLAVHGDHHTASWVSSMLGAQFLPRAFPQARALTWQDWAGGGGEQGATETQTATGRLRQALQPTVKMTQAPGWPRATATAPRHTRRPHLPLPPHPLGWTGFQSNVRIRSPIQCSRHDRLA